MTIDWDGKTYCGLNLNWNYDKGYVDMSISGYVEKVLHKFQHPKPKLPQYSPHLAPTPQFGLKAQETPDKDNSPLLDEDGQQFIRQVTGSFLFYARMIDNTMLKTLNTIARKQDKPTELTRKWAKQLLDYAATYPNTTIRYFASDMILKQHSNLS